MDEIIVTLQLQFMFLEAVFEHVVMHCYQAECQD